MHAAIVTALSLAVTLVACCFPQQLAVTAPILLALLVAFIGLPHGAADHLYAKSLFGDALGTAGMAAFLSLYLVVAAAVVAAWLSNPGLAIVAFFVISAWHFGQEEPASAGALTAGADDRSAGTVRFARGGLVIWGSILFQQHATAEILRAICPAEASAAVGFAVGVLWPIAIIALALFGLRVLVQLFDLVRGGVNVRPALVTEISTSVSFLVLTAVVTPLVSFAVYFCAWHSALGLNRLRRALRTTWPKLVETLAPLTLSAIALCVFGAAYIWRAPEISQNLLRTTFLGLSAVAVPHIVLHGIGPVVAARLGRPSPPTSPTEVFA